MSPLIHLQSPLNLEYLLRNEILSVSNNDVIFLCSGGQTLGFNKGLLCANFPLFEQILPMAMNELEKYLPKDAKLFITIDSVDAESLSRYLLSSISSKSKMSKEEDILRIDAMLRSSCNFGHELTEMKSVEPSDIVQSVMEEVLSSSVASQNISKIEFVDAAEISSSTEILTMSSIQSKSTEQFYGSAQDDKSALKEINVMFDDLEVTLEDSFVGNDVTDEILGGQLEETVEAATEEGQLNVGDLLMEVLENIKYSDENLEINIETIQSGGAPNDDLASLEEPTKPVKQLVAFFEENCPPPDGKPDESNNHSTTMSVDTICQETSDTSDLMMFAVTDFQVVEEESRNDMDVSVQQEPEDASKMTLEEDYTPEVEVGIIPVSNVENETKDQGEDSVGMTVVDAVVSQIEEEVIVDVDKEYVCGDEAIEKQYFSEDVATESVEVAQAVGHDLEMSVKADRRLEMEESNNDICEDNSGDIHEPPRAGGDSGQTPSSVTNANAAPSGGKHLTQEQRTQIVHECVEDKVSPAVLAKKWGCNPGTIRMWVKKAGMTLPKTYSVTQLPEESVTAAVGEGGLDVDTSKEPQAGADVATENLPADRKEPSLLDSINYLMNEGNEDDSGEATSATIDAIAKPASDTSPEPTSEDDTYCDVDEEITFNLEKSLGKKVVPGPVLGVDEDTVPDVPAYEPMLPSREWDYSDTEIDEMFQTCIEEEVIIPSRPSTPNIAEKRDSDLMFGQVSGPKPEGDEVSSKMEKTTVTEEKEAEYEEHEDYDYEEDDNYDEEISKLETQIDDMKQKVVSKPEVDLVEKNKKRPAEDNLEEQSMKKAKLEDETVSCYFCEKTFKNAQDLLQHLSSAHFSKELLSKYPLGVEETCGICIQEERKRKYVMKDSKNKGPYIYHVGKLHMRALEFMDTVLQADLVQKLCVDVKSLSFLPSTMEDQNPIVSLEENALNTSVKVEKPQAQENQKEPVSKIGKVDGESTDAKIKEMKKKRKSDAQNSKQDNVDQSCADFSEGSKRKRRSVRKKGDDTVKDIDSTDEAPNEDVSLKENDKQNNSEHNNESTSAGTEGSKGAIETDIVEALKARPKSTAESLLCSLCEDSPVFRRSTLLLHLSSAHFGKQLKTFADTELGGDCKLCIEENKARVFKTTPNRLNVYLRHIGSVHEKVIELIPKEEKNLEMLDALNNQSIKEAEDVASKSFDSSMDTSSNSVHADESLNTGDECKPSKSPRAEGVPRGGPKDGVSVPCSMCVSNDVLFNSKCKLMEHLAIHFNKHLTESYGGLFQENGQCPMCVAEKKSSIFTMTSKNKTNLMRHFGSTHRVVVDLIPKEEKHREMINFLGGSLNTVQDNDMVNSNENKDQQETTKSQNNVQVKTSNKETVEPVSEPVASDDATKSNNTKAENEENEKPKKRGRPTKIPRKVAIPANPSVEVGTSVEDQVTSATTGVPNVKIDESLDKMKKELNLASTIQITKKTKSASKTAPKDEKEKAPAPASNSAEAKPELPSALSKLSSVLTIEKKAPRAAVSAPAQPQPQTKSFQCGECPSVLGSVLELAKHMKQHKRK